MSKVATTYMLRQPQGNGRGAIVYDAQRIKERIMVTFNKECIVLYMHDLQSETV